MKKLLLLLLLSGLTLAASHGQAISPYLTGQNAWLPTALGTQVFNGQLDRLWPVVKQSKVKMIRIGGNGVNSNLVTNAQYIALIDSIRRIGAEPMVQVSEGRGRFTEAQAAQVVQHVNITMSRNVKYWIIGNEPDLNIASQPNPVSVAGVEAYIKAFATAMKAVDPTILTVGPENASYNGYFPALVGGANDITGTDANGRYYIDVVTFHTYPFSGTQTRASVMSGPNNLTTNVTNLLGLMANANTLHNRTGANALRWALTEFNVDYANPAANTVEGVGMHSFLNGQFWAEVFGVGMKYEAVSMQAWSIHEGSGARGTGDLGYLDGATAATVKPRSAFWHEMLVSENMHGSNLNATDNQTLVKVLSSTDNGTTAVMVLNESDATDYDFTVQLNTAAVPGAAALKINVPAGINTAYNDKIYAQSTLVLLFNSQGALTKKIVYSLQHTQQTLPPTYLNPGHAYTLANFAADKTFTCIAPEAVTYSATVLGEFTSISWNFGAGATPATGTGKNPPAVTYATAGNPTVTMTLVNPDTTIVVMKANYVQVSTCARTPYSGTAAVIPGVLKTVEYDNGGEGVAYHDSDAANRGAAADPTVPRPNEGVDTENGDAGYTNVGYSATGEWLKYSVNILRSGFYKVTVRVSSGATAGGSLRLSINDVNKTGVVAVPSTGSYTTYQDVVLTNVYLDASPNATLKFDVVSASLNFSKLTFVEQPSTGIVENRVYNATNDANGNQDAVELLGNPYPSPLDWSTVTPAQRPGMDAAMYVYQSTGQYAGTYRSYANGIGTSPLVVAGAGYFARVSTAGTPGAVSLTNANRVTSFGPQPAFGRGLADTRPRLHLQLAGAHLSDDTFLYLQAGATAGVDAEYDATKLPNPAGLDLATLSGNRPLAINGLALLDAAEVVVPLHLRVPQAGSFGFEVADLTNFGSAAVYLRDALTGTQQRLATGTHYAFTLATATSGTSRFSLVLRPATITAAHAELNAASVSLYPNPAHGRFTVLLPPLAGQQEVRATLFNALGQAVLTHIIPVAATGATAHFQTPTLPAGVYTLRLQTQNQALTRRVVLE